MKRTTMYRHSRMCEFCHFDREDYRHLRTCVPRSRWPERKPEPEQETVLEALGITDDNICECGYVAGTGAGAVRKMKTHLRTSKMHREEITNSA